MTPEEPLAVSPCPKCQSPRLVTALELGTLIPCDACGVPFLAQRVEDPPPTPAMPVEPLPNRGWRGLPPPPELRGRLSWGTATATAVLYFLFAALSLVVGGLVTFAGGLRFLNTGQGLEGLAFGLLNLIGVGLMVYAGVGLLRHGALGRAAGVLCGCIGFVNAVAVAKAKPDAPERELIGWLFNGLMLLWLILCGVSFNMVGKKPYQPE